MLYYIIVSLFMKQVRSFEDDYGEFPNRPIIHTLASVSPPYELECVPLMSPVKYCVSPSRGVDRSVMIGDS